MRWNILLVLFMVASTKLSCQLPVAKAKEFLVQLKPKTDASFLQHKLRSLSPDLIWTIDRLIPNMDLWKIAYKGTSNDAILLEQLKTISCIEIAQYNHKVTLRTPQSTLPNDPLFSNQWQYINTITNPGTAGVDLDADLAWDITTGGLTSQNDTIVIAVLDNGISLVHDDFGNNLWRNHAEIPNNNIDDDQNGYVDDFLGWNSTTDNDLIAGGGHGTAVAGIIGAEGSNNNGLSGVNWTVKLMIIRNDFNVDEAKVLTAYGYALTQRKLYNQTQGQKGAFVVASNASWGLDYGQAVDAPLWCAFYDSLGAYGILNIAATANANVDVDLYGDLPTTCPSDYMVAVTNINNLGYKVSNAAYGNTHIDLGAFGDGVYTTASPTGYGTFGGTSGATPHVTGTVGLLYAAACSNFMSYARIYPDSAALKMKSYLLNGVVPNVDLIGNSVSEGRLNCYNSVLQCFNECPGNCYGPYQIALGHLIDTSAQLTWQFTPGVQQLKYRIKPLGGNWSNFSTLALNQDSLQLTNLTACQEYAIEFVPLCTAGSDTVGFDFKTKGCCEAVSGLNAYAISADSICCSWQPLIAATQYLISYKKPLESSWQSQAVVASSSGCLSMLDSCQSYQIRLLAICGNGDTTSTDTLMVSTIACSTCSSISYCPSSGNNSNDDWIDSFSVDNVVYASGNNGGYILFDSVAILLGKGDYHQVSISQGRTYVEFVKIWLDLNQDGDFEDPEEQLFSEILATTETTKKGSFIVPVSALLGVTRMRVSMKYNSGPAPCDNFTYGEVEDYCVQVIEGNAVQEPSSNLELVKVYPNPFKHAFNVSVNLIKNSPISLKLIAVSGQTVWQKSFSDLGPGQHKIGINTSLASGIYLLEVKDKSSLQYLKIIQGP